MSVAIAEADVKAPMVSHLAPLVDLLRRALEGGDVTLRLMAPHPEFAALTQFSTREVWIGEDGRGVDFLESLVHELHHLVDGPVHPRLADAAEAKVCGATAETLAAMGVAR